MQDDDFLYIGNLDGRMVRVDLNSHSLDQGWRYPTDDPLGAIYGKPLPEDDTVFGAGYTCTGNNCDGEVFAIGKTDGLLRWPGGAFQINTKLAGTVALTDELVLFGTSAVNRDEDPPGYLYALARQPEAEGSRLRWRVPLDGVVLGSPAVDDGVAYLGTMGHTLYAIDLADDPRYDLDPSGRILWQFSGGGAIVTSPLVHDGKIYFGDFNDRFYRLDIEARRQTRLQDPDSPLIRGEWEFDTGAWTWAQALIDEDTVYASTLDGGVHALDLESGALKWSAKIDGQVVAAPALFERPRGSTTEKILAVPSGDRDVHAISTFDGSEAGVFTTGSAVKSSPTVIGDTLYVHTNDGDLMWFSTVDRSRRGCIELEGGASCG